MDNMKARYFGMFVALAGLSGWLLNDFGSGYKSSVDALCQPLWVKMARNDPALSCYLTADIARLCKPEEKSHLAAVIRRYRWDEYVSVAATAYSLVMPGLFGVAEDDGRETIDSLMRARMGGKPLSPELEEKMINDIIASKKRGVERFKIAGLEKALEVETLSDEVFIQRIQYIGHQGYMSEWDFGVWNDRLVTEAFDGLRREASSCEK
jgi:hypothetical protein